jgi:ABC-2 type transport system ATP-binding protein
MGQRSAVELAGLGRFFGALEAVKGISLEIREGETFALLGPNGAGKTTTLSMLSTLLPPSYGDARIFGRSLRQDVVGIRRLVGLAPQQISLYPKLSGDEKEWGVLTRLQIAPIPRLASRWEIRSPTCFSCC